MPFLDLHSTEIFYTKLLPLRTSTEATFNIHLLLSYVATCVVKMIRIRLKEANGTRGGCQEIKNMLTYLCKSRKENVTDNATKELHEYVEHVKLSAEVEQGYMTLGELIDIEKEEAAKEAAEKAAEKAARETKVMLICELLEECGEVPEALRERLESEADQGVLSKWLKLAARAGSIEEFMEKMDS